MACFFKEVPAALGMVGIVLATIILLLAVYAMIVGWCKLVVNSAFMLFLSIATIPMLQQRTTLMHMSLSILLAGGLIGGAILGRSLLPKR